MEKVASTATLSNDDLHKIATFGFGAALSTPVNGFQPPAVQELAGRFAAKLKVASARHDSLVELIRGHLQGAPAAA